MTSVPIATLVPPAVVEDRLDDDRRFEAFYREHAAYVAGVVFRLVGHDGDIDDVVQDTFVAASSHLHQLKEPSAARAWLVAIAVRRVKRHLGRRHRQRVLAVRVGEIAAQFSDPRDQRAVDELYDALDRLPLDLRVPWVLARVEQFTLPDVAAFCGISLATVKRRIVESEQFLQRMLSR
jgi:RNA polymerase sigma-70 factor (ECF subfamily)